jgi:hypothetical protein
MIKDLDSVRNVDVIKQFRKTAINRFVVNRCGYDCCRRVLSNFENTAYKGHCSLWCKEMQSPPKIKNQCKHCGIVTQPFKRKTIIGFGQSSGVYPSYCKEHFMEFGRHASRRKKLQN